MNGKTIGIIVLAVAVLLVIIGIRGSQNAIFPFLPNFASSSNQTPNNNISHQNPSPSVPATDPSKCPSGYLWNAATRTCYRPVHA